MSICCVRTWILTQRDGLLPSHFDAILGPIVYDRGELNARSASESLGNPQLCAAAPWIRGDLFVTGPYRFAANNPQRRPMLADTDRCIGRADAISRFLLVETFDRPVLQRMKRDDG